MTFLWFKFLIILFGAMKFLLHYNHESGYFTFSDHTYSRRVNWVPTDDRDLHSDVMILAFACFTQNDLCVYVFHVCVCVH